MDLRALASAFTFATIAIACSSSETVVTAPPTDAGVTPAPGLSATDYCAQVAAKTCAAYAMCAPAFYADNWASDAARCVAATAAACTAFAPHPDDANAASARKACIDALDLSTCGAYGATQVDSYPAECAFHGPLTNGSPCNHDGSCASGTCEIANGLHCGTCIDSPGVGADCAGDGCLQPLACVFDAFTGKGTCHNVGQLGDTCDSNRPCSIALACTNNVCAAPVAIGAYCASSADCGIGNACNTSNVCEAFQTKALGEECGVLTAGAIGYCASGSCRPTDGVPSKGTCVARIAVGQACGGSLDIFDGPCELPARCLHGTCTIPGPTLCAAPVVPSEKATTCSVDGAATTLTFHNTSANRDLAVYWVEQTCLEVFYTSLPPGSTWAEPTFAGHQWRVRDADTNELVKEGVGATTASTLDAP